MSWMRRRFFGVALFAALLLPGPLRASPASDFAARLAQTGWSLQQLEGLLRALPQSAVATPTPEAVVSYLALVSENVSALAAESAERTTDEQRRVMGEGWKALASLLKDQSSLATNRGLIAVASALGSLETTCRTVPGRS